MRRRLLASVFAFATLAAAPALAETAADCQRLADLSVAASKKATALHDEAALYRAILNRPIDAPLVVYNADPTRLDIMLKAADTVIRTRRAQQTDKSLSDAEREQARVTAYVLEQWSDFLLETRSRKLAGLEIDRTNNKYTRTLDRARRRTGKLAPLIAFADVEANEALRAQLACWAKVRSGRRTEAPATEPLLGPRTGAYSSNNGEMRLTVNGSAVTGTYFGGSARVAGTVSDGVLSGYWMQNSGPERCATAHDGSYYWGRIEFRYQRDGGWIGAMGYCDEYPARPGWDGQPKAPA